MTLTREIVRGAAGIRHQRHAARVVCPIVQTVIFMGLLALVSGCTKFDLRRAIPWAESEGNPKQPVRLSALWTQTVLNTGGRAPLRGFGGRLMFYPEGKDKPVRVDGTLTVYAYDEQGRDPSDCIPDRKYVFTPEQIEQHRSKTMLGQSYSFWLPWDEVGGSQREIGLIARFEPKTGGVVMSEVSRHILPGPTVSTADEVARHVAARRARGNFAQGDVAPAAYHSRRSNTTSNGRANVEWSATDPRQHGQMSRRMTTTTINVHPGFISHQPQPPNQWQQPASPIAAGPPADRVNDHRMVQRNYVAGANRFYNSQRTYVTGNSAAQVSYGPAQAVAPPPGTYAGPAYPANMPTTAPPTVPYAPVPAGYQPPSGRFVPGRFRVQGGPIPRPRSATSWTRPHPAGWPSDPGYGPQVVPATPVPQAAGSYPQAPY